MSWKDIVGILLVAGGIFVGFIAMISPLFELGVAVIVVVAVVAVLLSNALYHW